jgi:hypothetical protein
MNFLRIIEVLAIIFLLKIYFLFLLFNLNDLWTGRQFLENPGGSAQDILDSVHSKNGRQVDSLVSRGFFNKSYGRRGMVHSGPLDPQRRARIRSLLQLKRYPTGSIGSLIYGQDFMWSELTSDRWIPIHGTDPIPPEAVSDAQIQPSANRSTVPNPSRSSGPR